MINPLRPMLHSPPNPTQPESRTATQPTASPARRRLATALAALALVAAPAAPSKSASGPESLVPANIQPQSDDKGNQWSLNNYGFLQNTGNSFFNNILMLHVGGQQFYNYQPMMTPDGKEFVLPGQQPVMGLQVTRRIRLLEKDGVMRYLDLFQNPGTTAVNTTIEYRNNFAAPVKGLLTDRGTVNPTTLAKGETGVIVTSKQAGQRAVVFVLAAPSAKLRPNLTVRGQYEAHFSYPISVPPGQTVAIAYTVSFAPPPSDGDRTAAAKIFKAMPAARFLKSLRREDLALLANFAVGGGSEPSSLLASQGVDSLDVERTGSDVLALGDRTRLTGAASCSTLSVTTAHGEASIPFEQIAAMVGGPRAGGQTRIFLRDGQIVSGTFRASDFRFTMPSGANVDLDLATLDRLVRKSTPDEGKWSPQATALLVTQQGEHLALGEGLARFEVTTPWGPLAFGMDEVLWFGPVDGGSIGLQIEFRDGSRFQGYLSGSAVVLPTRLFGPREFRPSDIRGLVTAGALAAPKDTGPTEAAPAQPYLLLAGGQRLVGQADTQSLTVLTSAKAIEIPPSGLRSLRNVIDEAADDERVDRDSPPFQIELWGGGTVLGQLREPVLPVRFRQSLWSVPVADIIELHNPAPRLSDEVRLKIAGHIRDLGSDDWKTREAASEALATYGFLARPLLDEALKSSADPEVRRRVEQLVSEME